MFVGRGALRCGWALVVRAGFSPGELAPKGTSDLPWRLALNGAVDLPLRPPPMAPATCRGGCPLNGARRLFPS